MRKQVEWTVRVRLFHPEPVARPPRHGPAYDLVGWSEHPPTHPEGLVVARKPAREGQTVGVYHASGFHVVLGRHDEVGGEWPAVLGPFALLDNAEGTADFLRGEGWEAEVVPAYGGDTVAEVAIPGVGE